ncbi:MAG TPA: hypothetical protein VFK48_17765 [Usitatibacter sp.]|nr:hypothetical protein [Usitatibacter sp.]
MKSTSHTTFKTLAVITVLLVVAGSLAGTVVTSAEKAASDAHGFVGTAPAMGATEGNVTDLSY